MSTVSGSIGLLTIPGVAAADQLETQQNIKRKEKNNELNYGFDPYDLEEVREFNSGMRDIVEEKGKRQLKNIGAKLSKKQKKAIDDVNRPIETVIKIQVNNDSFSTSSIEESRNGEKKVVGKKVKKHAQVAEKWGWDK